MVHVLNIGHGGPFAAEDCDFLTVNKRGERFMNENGSVMFITNACMAQPDCDAWDIYDGNFKDNLLKTVPENISVLGVPMVDEHTDEKMENAIADGTLFRADTLAELAEQMGVPAENLEKTVARYNELAAAGKDEDFNTDPTHMFPVTTPPFYVSHIPVTVLAVIFGLNCDEYLRVCDASDTPLEGLYVIGNMQGNFFAQDYPMITPGISHGRCLTFGRRLGQALAAGTLIDV